MFFNDLIQRRLAALLQPWLRDDPELEFKLGFLRSNGTLNNVSFSTSALNELLEDPSRCCFKEVSVEHLSIKISPWSLSAFTLAIRGLRFVVSLGEEEDERGVKWRPRVKDITMEDKNRVLAEIDPEGCTLHASLRRITDITTRTWRKSILNTLFAHCQIQFHDVHVLFQSPSSHNAFSCSLYVKKVEAGSQTFGHRCFVIGLMGSFIVPSKESSFDIDIDRFEIRLNSKNSSSSVIPMTNMSALVNVTNLQFTSICLRVPRLEISFSPADLSVMLLFYALLSKESKCVRPGRLLWKIVASRISSLLPFTNQSIHKVVKFACLWLQYVNTYKNLLLLVGYPANDLMKRSAEMMYRDKTYSRSVKSNWKLISKIENDLPLEAIAFARQKTRFRLASRGPGNSDSFDELLGKRLIWKLPQLLMLILSLVGSLFRCFAMFLLLHKALAIFRKSHHKYDTFQEDCRLGIGISLIVQQISMSVSPDDSVKRSAYGKSVTVSALSYQDLLSLHILADTFFLRYAVNVSEQHFMSSFGCLKILSSPLVNAGASSKSKEPATKKFDEKQIMWAEPSQIIYFPEATDVGGETSVPHLDHIIGRMWLNWKESYSKVEEVISNMPTPWILCEVKSYLRHRSLNDFSSWFWNCGLAVGRLNFYLDYFSVATIIVLLRQIQCSLSSNDRMRDNVVLNPLNQDPPARDLSSRCRSYSSKIESTIIRILPQKHIQIGVLISGPHIQLSLLNNNFYSKDVGDHPVSHVTIDICNIELAVSPKLEDYLGLSSENAGTSEYHELGPHEIDAPESDNEDYNCQEQISLSAYLKVYGLKAYLVESADSDKYQIIVLSPTTTRLQYTRKDHHTYDSKIVALSATFCCIATGFTMLVFLDEWHTLMKVFSGVFYESLAFAMYGSSDGHGPNYQELPSRESVFSDSERERTVLNIGCHESLVTNTRFFVHSSCDLKSFDVVLHNSRESYNLENHMNVMPIERETGRISVTHDTSGLGIYISLQQLMTELNIKGGDMDFTMDITGLRSIIFRYLDESESSFDKSELKNLLGALYFLAEAAITHSRVCLCLRSFTDFPSIRVNNTDNLSCSHGKTTHMLGDLPLEVNGEGLVDHWLSANICISGIYMVGWEVKDILVSELKLEEISSVFSVGGAFQNISWRFKGGSVLLEAMAAALFIECCTSYCHCILELWSASRSHEQVVVSQQIKDMAAQDGHLGIKSQQVQPWDCLEVFSLLLSHLTFVLVARDEYGRLRELLFEVDFCLNLKLLNMVGKFSMDIPKFSMSSLFMHGGMKDKGRATQSSLLSSISEDSSSNSNGKDCSSRLSNEETIQSGQADASDSSLSSSKKGFQIDSSMSSLRPKVLHFSPQKYLLKDLKCFLAIEGPVTRDQTSHALLNDIWVGNGSFSGFDMTITLTEIKMILSAYESIFEASLRKRTSKEESAKRPNNQEPEGSTEEIIPDGTVVAIQDTDQHMYIAVDGSETNYDIAGTIHYSLVGKRALFRVKYHNLRQWKSKTQYFSLISLYANDASGKPLRLSSNPKSRFVSISSSSDSESALWRSFKEDTYEGAVELEFSSPLAKKTFHLLNKKNDCAVAFTDGVLEFVSKPGNLFKWKVFSVPGPGNLMMPNGSPWGSAETNLESDSNIIEIGESGTNRNHVGVTITVDKVTLTIVHELSNTDETFQLLQGSVAPNQTIIQISKSKLRVMNSSVIVLYFFDAQKNSWMDFVQPLEFHCFYCSKFHVRGSENMHGVPSHFYAKIKEVNFSVGELLLDILLFVIGELDIAGPYAVKKPVVLTNGGKVENQSGMTLLCHFYDNEDVSISARQSTTVRLRHLASANQPPEASFISLQLRMQDFLSTSPIHLSLLETRKFAWRTRIISSKDSNSFPGPLIVVEISRAIEEGISVVVAPMLKIHNETDFPLELRFQRPQHKETESASLMLKAGDVIDDSLTAFDAVDLSGGLRKALTSVSVGNFIFSFRPNIDDHSRRLNLSLVEWSDDLKGGKPVHLSGIFDKLSYKVRKAFSVDSMKCSLRSANCVLKSEEAVVANIHFLILTVGKGMPVINPDNFGYAPGNKDSPVAMQEQKEIFVLPTIQVSNLLHTEIHVNLTDRDLQNSTDNGNTWNNATIPCGSTVNFYANPETFYFTATLTSFDSRSKSINSSDWVRKLQKQKTDIPHLDIELDFGGGKYFATLRLSRGHRGTLKVVILTSYALENNTNALLLCFDSNQKSVSSEDAKRFGPSIPPELGSSLPPNSIASWFMKFPKLRLKLLEEKALDTQLDLDALSGLAEIDLEVEDISGLKTFMRLGVSLRPSTGKEALSQIVTLSSRYVVCNESKEIITVRQCYMEGMEELIAINSKQKIALRLKRVMKNKRETNIMENLLRKHTKAQDDISLFIQFRLNESGLSWSGPVCVASLGRFFLKFRKSSDYTENQLNHQSDEDNLSHFAVVHVVEEGSSIVLHFHRPPDTDLPYRIENRLHDAPIAYYQKGSSEPEALGAGVSVSYVWDDLTLPRKLVIQLDDVHVLREINLDKVRSWKPFYRNKRTRGLGFQVPFEKKSEGDQQNTYSQLLRTETVKVGYEIYAEGVTRILRICDFPNSHKVNEPYGTRTKMRLRISYLSVHLLEHIKQEVDLSEPSNDAPIIIARFERIDCDSMFTSQHKYNQIRVQSLSVDAKWIGAPFATMLRRHQSENSDTHDYILRIIIVLLPSGSHVKQVKHLSIVLLPLNLNLDEETLMKIVPFWRSSLSDPNAPRQQYYFDHFEIHPIKIVASFLPGELYYSYSTTQDTLRSLLHSVIKMPAIQSKTVELNGVLVTHALITLRELTIKCAQHYSWYSMRAIYMAKGSPLLPPAFASIFDDLASSSLDVFFDPSSGLLNLPGMTLGTLKLISKFIDNKGFSGTKRYFGDLGKTLKTAGSNILFAAVTEVSDSVLKGAETSGFSGMVGGFHHGILKLAMEPTVLGNAFMEGGPDRKIKLDRSPGIDELYIEGYLQAMLDTMYKQEYLRIKVIDNLVILKNLPPSSALIKEIMDSVNGFLASKALVKGETTTAHSLRYMRGEREWRIGPTMLTLCEHLFVSFAIRFLRKQAGNFVGSIKLNAKAKEDEDKAIVQSPDGGDKQKVKLAWKWGIGKFVLSGIVAYIDGRLCRNIPNPLARRIVSGFLLSFLDTNDAESK